MGRTSSTPSSFNDVETGHSSCGSYSTPPNLAVNLAALQTGFAAIAERFGMDWADARPSHPPPGEMLLVSKSDHCLADILYRWRTGELEMIPTAIVSIIRERPTVSISATFRFIVCR